MTTLADCLSRPGRVLGTWSQFSDPDLIDGLGAAGFDFTIIDLEHGGLGLESAVRLIRACEAARVLPLARVPRGSFAMATQLFDSGAAGVLVPGVESAEEARDWVAATRFGPDGTRGACPIVRAAAHSLKPWREFAASTPGCILMIESTAGVEHSEAICGVSGVAGVMPGPFDLSVAMGVPGQVDHPGLRAAIQRVIIAADAAALPVLMPVFAPDREGLQLELSHWHTHGVRHFAIGADKIIVMQALSRYRKWAASAD